jgi:hypothetical protein
VEFVWLPTFERTIGGALTGRDLTEAQRAELKRLAAIIRTESPNV